MDMKEIWAFGEDFFYDGFLSFVIVTVLTFLIIRLIIPALNAAEETLRKNQGDSRYMMFHYLFTSLKTVVRLVGAIIILSRVRVLRSFGAAALGATSILAVAVSLAAQESFSNYISGFFLALYQPFKTGDLIVLSEKGIAGIVKEINLRHIVLQTIENTTIIVPNSVMNTAVIEDRNVEEKYYSGGISVTVAYDTDLDKAKDILRSIVSAHPGSMDVRTEEEKAQGVPEVNVRVNALQDYGIELKTFVRTKNYGDFFSAASDIRQQIVEEFRKNGITIPYPVTTVELRDRRG